TRLASTAATIVAPFNRRYLAHVRRAAQAVAAGDIGEVVEVTAHWSGPYRSRFSPGSGTYRGSAGPREGLLVDVGGHAIDVIAFLVGPAAGLSVKRADLVHNERGAEVQVCTVLAAGPAEVRLDILDEPEPGRCGSWRVVVRGSTGRLTLDDAGCLRGGGTARQFIPGSELARPVTDLLRCVRG